MVEAGQRRPWAILTTGATQLLTAVAAARARGLAAEDLEVYAFFKPHPPLLRLVEALSDWFGLAYSGALKDDVDYSLGRRHLLAHPAEWRWLVQPGAIAQRQILRQNPKLTGLRGRRMITPFKPYDDLSLLLAGVNPPEIMFIADGPMVFGQFGSARKDWTWRGIRNLAASLPADVDIHSPAYLAESSRVFGRPVVIPDRFMEECYRRAGELPLVRQVADRFAAPAGKGGALILSQNLHPGMAPPYEEVRYYADLVAFATTRQGGPVIFKPHPRDVAAKLGLIEDLCATVKPPPVFLSQDEATVPVEVLQRFLRLEGWRVYGACTSALMSARDMLEAAPCCVESPKLPETTNAGIRDFAARFRLPLEAMP